MSERIKWACKVVLAKLGEGPAGWRRLAGDVYGCAIEDGVGLASSSYDAASTLALDAIEDLADRGLIYAQGSEWALADGDSVKIPEPPEEVPHG